MKRKTISKLLLVLLLAMTSCFLLSSCKEKNSNYGTVQFNARRKHYTDDNYVYDEAALDSISKYAKENDILYFYNDANLMMLFLYENKNIVVPVLDVSALTGQTITYAEGESNTSLPNAVVTTKWVYYYSLLTQSTEKQKEYMADARNDLFYALFDNFDSFLFLLHDEYCMEKVCFEPSEYVCEKESSPYYGMNIREIYDLTKDDFDKRSDYSLSTVASENDDPIFNPFSNTWTDPLFVAAMARYELVDLGEIEKTVGKIILPSRKELNIVGYVETEADKLLSTGVSMDKNSDEYKIVMEQLNNPVFYSLCGNFLEE